MFNEIPETVRNRMAYLEEIDRRDRDDGTSRANRLRQVPPQTGRFIALLAAMAPEGNYFEIGMSAGYSTLWLGLACRQLGRRITTYEILSEKVRLARETFAQTGFDDVVQLVQGDAREHLKGVSGISFCFLDAEKEIYKDCYDLIVPRMISGGLLVADNAINHRDTLQPLVDEALTDPRVDAEVRVVLKSEALPGAADATGYHQLKWDASSYSSGAYFVKMVSGDFTRTQKVMLVK